MCVCVCGHAYLLLLEELKNGRMLNEEVEEEGGGSVL